MTQQQGAGRWRGLRAVPGRALIMAITAYRQMVSPLRPPSCRFVPTCSQYAVEALGEFGVVRGSWLSLVRLARCGPWHRGGWDPIPDRCCDGTERCAGHPRAVRESTDSVV